MDLETLPPAETVTANAARRTFLGREFVVVNSTLIVPGVLPGSKGPLYYSGSECSARPWQWNGMPLVGPDHPKDAGTGRHVSARAPDVLDRHALGAVYNTRFKNALKTEAWFDVELTRKHDRTFGTTILADLDAGRPIELSTGLFTQDVPVGNKVCGRTGKSYTHEARDFRPDHVAVLPRSVGACSVADGCGVGVNAAAGPETPDPADLGKVAAWLAGNGAAPGYGQVFVNGRDVWYVGGDGDSWAEKNLPVVKFSAVPGVGKVTYEAEAFPPGDAGWVQVVPKRRPRGKKTMAANEETPSWVRLDAPRPDCPGSDAGPCANCGGKGGKPGPCAGTGKGRAGTPKTNPALRDHNLNLARELLAAGDRPGVFHLAGLAGRLNTLTVPQLKGLRAEFVGSAAGKKAKADHVAAIESFLRAKPGAVRSMVAAEAARSAAKAGLGPTATAGKFWSKFGPAVKAFAAGAAAGVSRALAANEVGAVTAADLRLALLNLAAAGDKAALAPFLAGRRKKPGPGAQPDAAPAANVRPQGDAGLTTQEAEAVPKPNPDDVAYLTANCDCWKKPGRREALEAMPADAVADLRKAHEAKVPAPTGNADALTAADFRKVLDEQLAANAASFEAKLKDAVAEAAAAAARAAEEKLAANERRDLVARLASNARDDEAARKLKARYEKMDLDTLRDLADAAPAADAGHGFPAWLGAGGFGGPAVTGNAGGAEDAPDGLFDGGLDLYANASDAAKKAAA